MDASESAAILQQRIRQIGKRTAEMHLAFACDDKDPAFAPEPIAPEDVARWTDNAVARAETMFAMIQRSFKDSPDRTAPFARKLLDERDTIIGALDSGRHAPLEGVKIRHHGDFHLGQVLIAKDDAYILDFEGEPRRSLEERRAKAPPARDVAGFLRSIDYAVSTALDHAPNLTPEERATIAAPVRGWGDRLSAAYWDSYRETIGDAPLWPADDEERKRLLDVFLLEKALYEIEYELTNRPAWSHIPMEATLRILQQRGVIS